MGDEKRLLEYETPLPKAVRDQRLRTTIRGIALAIFSVPFGLFALFMLWIGVSGLAETIEHPPPHVDLPGDVFGIAMFVLIGLFCGFVFIRWFRAGCRIANHIE
jgi:hypothetical protein